MRLEPGGSFPGYTTDRPGGSYRGQIGCERHAVGPWRHRWADAFDRLVLVECREKPTALPHAIDGLLSDRPRSGSPGKFTAEQVTRIPQHTAPDSRSWADDLGLKVRLLPRATPELNAMDHLWRHAKRERVGSRATETVARSVLDACQNIIDLRPLDRLRQAGILSGNFWLAK
jgi:hypothetical protein